MLVHMLAQVDFPAVLAEVDSACRTWRKPTLLLFGQNDPFISPKSTFDFLEDKRTNFELAQLATRVSASAERCLLAPCSESFWSCTLSVSCCILPAAVLCVECTGCMCDTLVSGRWPQAT